VRLFRRKGERFTVEVETMYQDDGIYFTLIKNDVPVEFPLGLTISELKQLNNLDELQLIEDLYADEKMSKLAIGQYVITYDDIYELDPVERKLLRIPTEIPVSIELDNEGFVAAKTFAFIPKIHSDKYKNLHKIGTRNGAIIQLPTSESLLIEKSAYEVLHTIENQPDRENMNELAAYIAEVKKKAKLLGISVSGHIEKEDYEFIDEVDVNLQRSEDGIEIIPEYKHESLDKKILNEITETDTGYANLGNKRLFVKDETFETKKKVNKLNRIENKDIPKFVQNPTAFIPEDIDIPLDTFSDRVKGLGIRVYKAQPRMYARINEHGWFDVDPSIEIKDDEGNPISQEDAAYFEKDGGEYKQLDGETYVKIPENIDQFKELAKKAKDEARKQESPDLKLSDYILEIFENINHVEYNKPLIEKKEALIKGQVFDQQPPQSFHAKLKPFQEDGFKWMKALRIIGNGGLLADDMGLGKTIQVIAYLTYLQEQSKLTPTLLVLPKALIDNWVQELEKFAPDISKNLYIHAGPNRLKSAKLISQFDIVLTTYQTLSRDQTFMGLVDWEMVICDEAQEIKNPTTAKSIVVKALKNNGRLALTGTPVENNLTELWSIIDFVQPGILGSLKQFKEEYEKKLEREETTVEEVQRSIEEKIKYIYMRRMKSDELKGQIPIKTEHPVHLVPLGREQRAMYQTIINQVNNKEIHGLQAIQQLKMLCSHPGLLHDEYKQLKSNRVPKLAATMELINDIHDKDEKVLVFSEYIEMQAILKREILNTFNLNAQIINGTTGHRQQIVDKFNKTLGFEVLILSPKAAGTGLTITGANHVIHYTRWWNPAVENQATDRVYRIGQEKDVHVYYPIVEIGNGQKSVEEIIDDILNAKKSLAENVIVPSIGESIEKEVLKEIPELVAK